MFCHHNLPTAFAVCLSSARSCVHVGHGLALIPCRLLQLALKAPLREPSHPTFIFKVERDFFMNRFAGGRGSNSTAKPGSLVHLEEQRQGPLGKR